MGAVTDNRCVFRPVDGLSGIIPGARYRYLVIMLTIYWHDGHFDVEPVRWGRGVVGL
ncbi:hypothetical protein SAMN05660473_03348 [Arthrobacter sp. 49Tsu3.1M3]|nr:hypothetical protein SAMN05660473_03348 [Arthrobacter sp. 49Tsu3.1M3]